MAGLRNFSRVDKAISVASPSEAADSRVAFLVAYHKAVGLSSRVGACSRLVFRIVSTVALGSRIVLVA